MNRESNYLSKLLQIYVNNVYGSLSTDFTGTGEEKANLEFTLSSCAFTRKRYVPSMQVAKKKRRSITKPVG